MSSRPFVGAIAYGKSGVPCLVVECNPGRITLQRPDQSRIVVSPEAIVRWESCAEVGAESKGKISIVSITPKNKSLEPHSRKGLKAIDNSLEYRSPIDHSSKVSITPASIDQNTDRPEKVSGQVSEKNQIDKIDKIDIFTPLSGQQNFELFQPGDCVRINVGNPERFRHHGKSGLIKAFDPKDQTYRVELDDGCAGDWRSEFLQLAVEVNYE